MKSAVFHGQMDLRLDDVPEPEVSTGKVKVKVDWCGICGSDLHEYVAGPIFIPQPGAPHPITGETLPVAMGHEFAGQVVDVGDGVEGIATGDRVAIEPVYRCGECTACLDGRPHQCVKVGFFGFMGGGGGFSEYAVMPSYMVHHLPEGLTSEQGALVEPLAVGLRAVRRSGIQAGDTAIVFGAGPIGVVTVQCLKAIGAGRVIVAEVAQARKDKVLELGADLVLDPTEGDVAEGVLELTDGEGADYAFDAAGIEATLRGALLSTRKGGTVTIIAIWEGPVSVDPNEIVFHERTVVGTLAYTPRDFADTIGMLKDGSLAPDGMITQRIDLADVVAGGFDELVGHKDRHVKILVNTA